MIKRNTAKILIVLVVLDFLFIGTAQAKRTPPQKVIAVEDNEVKYTAPQRESKVHKQAGGYIEARDKKTDKKLWELKVYDVKFNPKIEKDVQEVYITSLKVENGKLIVANEAGDEYEVDPKSRTARKRVGLPGTSRSSILVK